MPFVLPSMMAVKLSGRTSAQAVLVATRVRSRDCWGVFTGLHADEHAEADEHPALGEGAVTHGTVNGIIEQVGGSTNWPE